MTRLGVALRVEVSYLYRAAAGPTVLVFPFSHICATTTSAAPPTLTGIASTSIISSTSPSLHTTLAFIQPLVFIRLLLRVPSLNISASEGLGPLPSHPFSAPIDHGRHYFHSKHPSSASRHPTLSRRLWARLQASNAAIPLAIQAGRRIRKTFHPA